MSKLVEEATKVLKAAAVDMDRISDEMSDNISSEDFEKVNLAYETAAALDVYASQMSGEEKVYEGHCEVDNGRAEVIIDGFKVRGKIQFEIMIDGEWVKGHRMNSQYGQVFYSQKKGSRIISPDDMGRVTMPLKMDE